MDDTDTVKIFHDDAIANGLRILGPDVNASEYRFTPVDRSTIRYGLGAVKGTGEQAVNALLKARQTGGPFNDLFDFCRRADKRLVNRRTSEALIRAGAFDSLDDHRARLLASVGIAIEAAEQAERNAMQVSLFDLFEASEQGGEHAPQYVEVPRWSERQRLNEEKLALGFYFSGHPFHAVQEEVSRFVRKPLAALEVRKETQFLAGLVVGVRSKITARGKMVFIQIDDGTSALEVSVFNELLAAERAKIREDEVLIVEGRVQRDDFAGEGRVKIVAERLLTLAEARGRFARHLRLSLNGQASANARVAVQRLRTLLAPYTPGDCPVRLAYRNGDATCELVFGDANRVRLEDDLLAALREWLSGDNVSVDYA
jgi:DNA polymerase-3 subunit alpha